MAQREKKTYNGKGNLSYHAKRCWGKDAVEAVQDSTLDKARDVLATIGKKTQQKLTLALKIAKNWSKSFSTTAPSKEAVR